MKTYNVAIISVSNLGGRHLEALKNEDCWKYLVII